MSAQCPIPLRQSGFTLIELIAVIVIMSILGVVATATFLDLRRSSRIAALEQTAATMLANAQAVKVWRMARDSGTSTIFRGFTVPTPAGDTWSSHDALITATMDGMTNGLGMARMMGCVPPDGDPPGGYGTYQACPGIPGAYFVVDGGTTSYFHLFKPDWSPGTYGSQCSIMYFPPYGIDAWQSLPPYEGKVMPGLYIFTADC